MIYHSNYIDGGMVVFKGKNMDKEILDSREEFSFMVHKIAGSQQLQFTMGIWTSNKGLHPSKNKDKVHIRAVNEPLFLYINMTWYPVRDIQLIILR